MRPDAIKTALLTLTPVVNGVRLTAEALAVLDELLPTADEAAAVRAFRGDETRLGEAEKFFRAVADVPKARARALALGLQLSFDARVKEVAGKTATLAAACALVRSSARLPRVLDAVLRIGNRLNDGVAAAANAITLQSLLKLGQTKAFDGRTTVLAYLVQRLSKADADALLLDQDLAAALAAARIDTRVLRDDVSALRKDLVGVEKLVRDEEERSSKADKLSATATATATVTATATATAMVTTTPTTATGTVASMPAAAAKVDEGRGGGGGPL